MIELSRQLIDEIKKPVLKKITAKVKNIHEYQATKRKIDRIENLLVLLPGFVKFKNYYNLDDDALRTFSSYITYKRFPKDSYIFKKGDKSDNFYGIIFGKVSIREHKILPKSQLTNEVNHINYSIIKNKHREDLVEVEFEKFQLNKGQCFGEWGLIYKSERSAHAYCLEDCELFVLSSSYFEQSFSKCMIKAEYDRKSKLIKSLPFFSTIPKSSFDLLYKSFLAVYYKKGSKIFEQGSRADTLFVVYQGQCSVKRNFSATNEQKIFNLMFLEPGDIIGLECLDYLPIIEESKIIQNKKDDEEEIVTKKIPVPVYKVSLFAEMDETIVIHIKLSNLGEYIKAFVKEMKFIRKEKDAILNRQIEDRIKIFEKQKITFREEQIRLRLKQLENGKSQEVFTNKVNNCINETVNCSRNVIKTNMLKKLKINLNTNYESEDYGLSTIWKSREKQNEDSDRSRKNTADTISRTQAPKKSFKSVLNFTNFTKQTNFNSTKTQSTYYETNSPNRTITSTLFYNNSTTNLKSKKSGGTGVFSNLEVETNSRNSSRKFTVEYTLNNDYPKYNNISETSFDKAINCNIKTWQRSLSEKSFISGKFKLPLFGQLPVNKKK